MSRRMSPATATTIVIGVTVLGMLVGALFCAGDPVPLSDGVLVDPWGMLTALLLWTVGGTGILAWLGVRQGGRRW